MPVESEPSRRGVREPVFNAAAWPVVATAAVIVGGYPLQGWLPAGTIETLAFSAAALEEGRWYTAVTALFLHGNWAHALLNAAAAFAFGTPVARALGLGARGVALFAVFFLTCGVLANLAFAAVHPGDATPLVGASGAVSGLMAAASRLIAGRGRLGPILSAPVIGMGAGWIVVNLLVAVTGVAPGADGASVAWEAHLAGFFAGILLFGWAMRLAHGR